MLLGALLASLLAQEAAEPQEAAPEVRQLVVFDFLPGRTGDAIRLFRETVLPLYRSNEAMVRFRGYREAESPEPMDLVVVSTFRGMEGMDASNEALSEQASRQGTSLGAIYGEIGALSDGHRDLFVEMDPRLSWGEVDTSSLLVIVSLRIAPGGASRYETLLADRILPWEKESSLVGGSESGRFLVADGWTHFRAVAVSSLGDWHRYVRAMRAQSWWGVADGLVWERKQQILAPVPELSVR